MKKYWPCAWFMMYSLCQHVALNISKPGHGMDMSLIQQQLLSLAIILQGNVSIRLYTYCSKITLSAKVCSTSKKCNKWLLHSKILTESEHLSHLIDSRVNGLAIVLNFKFFISLIFQSKITIYFLALLFQASHKAFLDYSSML